MERPQVCVGLEVGAQRARLTARSAGPADPLDAHPVANLDGTGLCTGAELDDLTDTLVATDLSRLGRVWQDGPAVGHDAEIRMADSRVRPWQVSESAPVPPRMRCSQVDQDLSRAGLGRVKLDNLGADFARLIVDESLVLLGDLGRSHGVEVYGLCCVRSKQDEVVMKLQGNEE